MNQIETMQKKYKYFAIFYDQLLAELEKIIFRQPEKNPRLALANRIPDQNLHILDVCCGTGSGSLTILGKSNSIMGVDISTEMLAVAQKKAAKLNIENISFCQMDCTKMDFPDETFDIIVSSYGMHEMDYDLMLKILKEISRVLKKNGKLFILDYARETGIVKRALFMTFLKIFYPKRVISFLDYDWRQIMNIVGLQLKAKEKYMLSNLICVEK